jgi:hypothetical protein
MRLAGMKKLMGLLAIGMQMSVVTAMVGASSFTVKEKESIVSAVSFLMLLKRRRGSNLAFLAELKRLLSICNERELLSMISGYEDENPELLTEGDTEQSRAIESVGYDFEPTQNQRDRFKRALYVVSESIDTRDLEILVALTPIPEAGKENIEFGHELFHRMERHGCIDENDTELLQEMLELLELRAALQILLKYRREFLPSSSTCTGDDLSHPIQEMNEDSSTELGNENGSLGFRRIWNMICTKLSSIASTLSSSPSSHAISCVQPEVGTSTEILSPLSFSPKEQPLPHSLDGLDSSSDSCSRDLDANCDPTSLEDSEITLMTKSLPKRKRPREEDEEQHPVEEGSDDGGSCDLVDSPPPTKTPCIAFISDDSVTVLSTAGHSASQFNDEADTWHWKMQSLQVNFSSTMSGYTESKSSDPQESASSLGCPNQR